MKSPVQRKTAIPLILTALALACVGLLPPSAFGVVPAPDGGYPGGNTAEGQNALLSLSTGSFNAAIGWLSLRGVTTGSFNTGVGAGTLALNTRDQNTAAGVGALLTNTTGFANTANGAFALLNNTTGLVNTATGVDALFTNTTGSNNTANGEEALEGSTGNHNTAVGSSALRSLTSGDTNTALGSFAGNNVITASNVICIGSHGADVSNTTWIENIYQTATVSATTLPVLVSNTGQLGTTSSSRRFKKEIKPMHEVSEAILALKPVTFHYKSDATNTPQFGLIAEEVAQVNADLVVRDDKGDIYTVRYDAVNAMLLNEFLKEHGKVQQQDRKIQEQEATIAELKNQVQTVVAHAKQQDTKIQRVSDRIQINSSPVVVTDR